MTASNIGKKIDFGKNTSVVKAHYYQKKSDLSMKRHNGNNVYTIKHGHSSSYDAEIRKVNNCMLHLSYLAETVLISSEIPKNERLAL